MRIHDGDDDLEAYEDPDEDDDETVPCPFCREPVFEDAERCPNCGKYLSREDMPYQRKPTWFIVGFLLCMVVVLSWYLWR